MTTVTCVYVKCEGASTSGADSPELEAWMDNHVATSPHPSEWPVTFRVEYEGSSLPGAAYRSPMMLEAVAGDELTDQPGSE